MDNYTAVIHLPVRAVSARAAQAAQLEIFQQLQLAMCRGIKTAEYEVDPVLDAQFTTTTIVGKNGDG